MATPAAVLSILVRADGIARTQAQVVGLDKTLDKTGKAGHKSMLGLAKGAGLAGAAFGALAVIGIKKSTDAFYESQKIAKQTEAVLKSTGGAAGVTAKQIGDLATAISKKTGVDDEAIQSGENLLLTFKNIHNEAGKNRDIFNQATRAAVDLSAAGFGSLHSTSIQLGKALNDPIKGMTALGRSGVTFSESQKQVITALVETGKASDLVRAQQLILKEVNSQVAGSAAAQATNMDRLKVTLENVQESIGAVLIPTLEKATGVMNRFVDGMMSGTGAGGRLVTVLQQVAAVLSGVFTTAIADASGWLHTHRDDLNAVAHAARNVGVAIRWAWEEVALPVVQRVLPAIKQIVTGAFTAIGGAVDVLVGLLTLDFRRMWNGVKAIFEGGAKGVLGIVRAMTAPMREIGSRIGEGLKAGFSAAWDGVKSLFESGVDKVIDFLNVLIKAINVIPGIDIKPITHGLPGKGSTPAGDARGMARGGAFAKTGGLVTSPITLMGEEAPRFPEYVIPTNPAYRGRAKGLLGQAAGALGMASGGVVSAFQSAVKSTHANKKAALALFEAGIVESGLENLSYGDADSRGALQVRDSTAKSMGLNNMDPGAVARAFMTRGFWGKGGAIALSNVYGSAGEVAQNVQGSAFPSRYDAVREQAQQYLTGGGGGLDIGDVLGKLPSPGDLPELFQGLGKYVIGKATAYVKDKIAAVTDYLGSGPSTLQPGMPGYGVKGVGSFMGVPMANWVIEALQYAQSKGVAVRPTSGYRPGFDPHTASGRSEHQGTQYPHGAVDFGGYNTGGDMKRAVVAATAGFKYPLLAPIGFHDEGHASGTGHARGGVFSYLGSYAKGGITSSEGLAHLHANEAVVPLKVGGAWFGPQRDVRSQVGKPWFGPNRPTYGETPGYTPPRAGASDVEVQFDPALVAAQEEANRLLEEANRIAEERAAIEKQRIELEQTLASNQLKILAMAGQGDQILAAVVAAVNGGIGGRVGLGFQSPSYSGGMASYR